MLETKIEKQRQQLKQGQNSIKLIAACRLNEGVVVLSTERKKELAKRLYDSTKKISFFIPASGSGSRMFHFLFEFMEQPNETNRGYVERFLTHIEDFAFFNQFPEDVQRALKNRSMDIGELTAFILNNKGFGLAHLPKGLIPFHKMGPFLLSPFQEHVIQGSALNQFATSFHFTIQPKFAELIEKSLQHLEGITAKKFNVSYSVQNPETDSVAFDSNFEPVCNEDGTVLTRPGGHGALFENFKQIESDLIFIKNIDNIQHFNKSELALETQQMLGGLFLEVQEKILQLCERFDRDMFVQLNATYQLFDKQVESMSENQICSLLQRPLRVCGMVINEGQPGGGPFWVEYDGEISKQIIEKAQIHPTVDQMKVMIQSSHFNPVMMVCQGNSEKQDLNQYRDENAYFKVDKNHRGQAIQFVELPGLWNGSMAKWNTVFVEVPSETFSPVKSVLDLLSNAHRP